MGPTCHREKKTVSWSAVCDKGGRAGSDGAERAGWLTGGGRVAVRGGRAWAGWAR